jgi:MYXO-CTERM domain-containing protein
MSPSRLLATLTLLLALVVASPTARAHEITDCTTTDDCAEGLACYEGGCYEPCQTDDDCEAGEETCIDGAVCVPTDEHTEGEGGGCSAAGRGSAGSIGALLLLGLAGAGLALRRRRR